MLKRILAWIILIGFVLLLLNIAIFKFYWQISLAVYVVILVFFVLSNGKIMPIQDSTGYGKAGGKGDTADRETIKDTCGNQDSKANR